MDRYGDNVVSQPLAGDGFRRRHDSCKAKLLSLMKSASIDVECEVFNLFSGLIPQEGLNRLERGRKRQREAERGRERQRKVERVGEI